MGDLCIQSLLRGDGGIWSKWVLKEVNVSKQLFFKGLVIVRYRNKKLLSSSVTVQSIYILTLTRYRSLPPQKRHVSTAAFHAATTYSSSIISTVP